VTVQCKARRYHESPSRQLKNEGENFFLRFMRRDQHYAPLYTAFGIGRTTLKYLTPALYGCVGGVCGGRGIRARPYWLPTNRVGGM